MLKTKNYIKFHIGDTILEGGASARPALPGDIVEVREGRVVAVLKRATHKSLVGVLDVTSKTRYGFTKRGTPIYLFTPWNKAYPSMYVASTIVDTSRNILVLVDFLDWESTTNLPRGDCREILGPCGDLAVEETALLRHVCPFPWKSKDIYPIVNRNVPKPNLLNTTTFHIDPPGCCDIDDAISLRKISEEEWDIRIHIADVATLLATNPWLQKAASFGQTLYKDGSIMASMFPKEVEESCSLLPNQPRRVLTLAFRFIMMSQIIEPTWHYEEIIIKESYTYESIYGRSYEPILRAVATTLKGELSTDSHEWIEQLMLFYNSEAAKILRDIGDGILRRHSEPDLKLLSTLEKYGDDVPKYLAYKSGEYCNSTEGEIRHWGLNRGVYCHASSPIRRWADCVNQTILMNHLFQFELPLLPSDPESLNESVKRARSYERDLFFIQVLLKSTNKDNEVTGILLEVNKTENESKIKIWVDAWKRVIKVRRDLRLENHIFQNNIEGSARENFYPGQRVQIAYFIDMGRRNWKERIVFSLSAV